MRPEIIQEDQGGFVNAMARGVDSSQMAGYGFVKILGDLVGSDTLRDFADSGVERNIREILANPAKVHSWEDIDGLSSFGSYIVESIGEQIPQLLIDVPLMLASIPTTGGTAGTAAIAGKQTLLAGIGKAAKRMMGEAAYANFQKHAGKALAANLFVQNAGESQLELEHAGESDPAAALMGGLAKSALDYYGLDKLIKASRVADVPAKDVLQVATRSLKAAGIGATAEGFTEAVQTAVDKAIIEVKKGSEYDFFSKNNASELVDAALKGGIVGGAFSGTFDALHEYSRYKHKKETDGTDSTRDAVDTVMAGAEVPEHTPASPISDAMAQEPEEERPIREGSTVEIDEEPAPQFRQGSVEELPEERNLPEMVRQASIIDIDELPEPQAEIDAQARAVAEGRKPAMEVSYNSPMPSPGILPTNTQAINTDFGTLLVASDEVQQSLFQQPILGEDLNVTNIKHFLSAPEAKLPRNVVDKLLYGIENPKIAASDIVVVGKDASGNQVYTQGIPKKQPRVLDTEEAKVAEVAGKIKPENSIVSAIANARQVAGPDVTLELKQNSEAIQERAIRLLEENALLSKKIEDTAKATNQNTEELRYKVFDLLGKREQSRLPEIARWVAENTQTNRYDKARFDEFANALIKLAQMGEQELSEKHKALGDVEEEQNNVSGPEPIEAVVARFEEKMQRPITKEELKKLVKMMRDREIEAAFSRAQVIHDGSEDSSGDSTGESELEYTTGVNVPQAEYGKDSEGPALHTQLSGETVIPPEAIKYAPIRTSVPEAFRSPKTGKVVKNLFETREQAAKAAKRLNELTPDHLKYTVYEGKDKKGKIYPRRKEVNGVKYYQIQKQENTDPTGLSAIEGRAQSDYVLDVFDTIREYALVREKAIKNARDKYFTTLTESKIKKKEYEREITRKEKERNDATLLPSQKQIKFNEIRELQKKIAKLEAEVEDLNKKQRAYQNATLYMKNTHTGERLYVPTTHITSLGKSLLKEEQTAGNSKKGDNSAQYSRKAFLHAYFTFIMEGWVVLGEQGKGRDKVVFETLEIPGYKIIWHGTHPWVQPIYIGGPKKKPNARTEPNEEVRAMLAEIPKNTYRLKKFNREGEEDIGIDNVFSGFRIPHKDMVTLSQYSSGRNEKAGATNTFADVSYDRESLETEFGEPDEFKQYTREEQEEFEFKEELKGDARKAYARSVGNDQQKMSYTAFKEYLERKKQGIVEFITGAVTHRIFFDEKINSTIAGFIDSASTSLGFDFGIDVGVLDVDNLNALFMSGAIDKSTLDSIYENNFKKDPKTKELKPSKKAFFLPNKGRALIMLNPDIIDRSYKKKNKDRSLVLFHVGHELGHAVKYFSYNNLAKKEQAALERMYNTFLKNYQTNPTQYPFDEWYSDQISHLLVRKHFKSRAKDYINAQSEKDKPIGLARKVLKQIAVKLKKLFDLLVAEIPEIRARQDVSFIRFAKYAASKNLFKNAETFGDERFYYYDGNGPTENTVESNTESVLDKAKNWFTDNFNQGGDSARKNPKIHRFIRPFFAGDSEIRKFAPDIANMFYWESNTKKEGPAVIVQGQLLNAQWKAQLDKIVGKYSEADMTAAAAQLSRQEETEVLNPAAKEIRELLERFYQRELATRPEQFTQPHIRNYFPRFSEKQQLEMRKEEFVEIIAKYLTGPAENKRRGAEEIYAKMLNDDIDEFGGFDPFLTPSAASIQHRRVLDYPELSKELYDAGFINTDPLQTLYNYFYKSTQRIAFMDEFGEQVPLKDAEGNIVYKRVLNTQAFYERQPIMTYDPGAKLKERIRTGVEAYMAKVNATIQGGPQRVNKWTGIHEYPQNGKWVPVEKEEGMLTPADAERVRLYVDGLYGRLAPNFNPKIKNAQSTAMAIVNWILLPFSAVSSLVEAPIVLAGLKKVGDMDIALASIKQYIRDPKEMMQIYEDLGLAETNATNAILADMYGYMNTSKLSQKMNAMLFKINGNEALVKFYRVLASHMGVQYLKRHAERARKGDAQSIRYLQELDLDIGAIKLWEDLGSPIRAKASLSDEEIAAEYTYVDPDTGEVFTRTGGEVHQKLFDALHRFIGMAVMRPQKSEVPVWANDPRFALLSHLKTFSWALHKNVFAGLYREAKQRFGEDKADAMMYLLAVAAGLLVVAAISNELREEIKYAFSGKTPPSDNMSNMEYVNHLIFNRIGLGSNLSFWKDALTNKYNHSLGAIGLSPTASVADRFITADDKLTAAFRVTPIISQQYGMQKAIRELWYG